MHLISDFTDNLHLTYPHNNSFADAGESIVLGWRSDREVGLVKCDADGTRRELCRFDLERQLEKLLWCDTALDANITVTIANNQIWTFDHRNDSKPCLVYETPATARLHSIPAIRADGQKIICSLCENDRHSALLLNLKTGGQRVLFEKPWFANHFHFCPHDPEWIGFSHEGNCALIMDRVWGWHAKEAPEGKCFFEQFASIPDRVLYVGHERWSFHDRSVLIVAYGDGPGKPRGIYEAFVDGRPQRLIGEADRDFHLDVSRDGRWIVIDTTGTYDAPGKGWENAWPLTDILVMDRATGERRFVAHSRLAKHPSHAHPIFSVDGRHVYFNEASEDGLRNRVWRADNPFLTS